MKKSIRDQVKQLSRKELEDIVVKFAGKRLNYYYLLINYFEKEDGEEQYFEAAKADIDKLKVKFSNGKIPELLQAEFLKAAGKRVTLFSKVSKNKVFEANLLIYILETQFSEQEILLGSIFRTYDYKVALLVKRLITIVTTKIHEDYKIDYEEKINRYLKLLHKKSIHTNLVMKLPKQI